MTKRYDLSDLAHMIAHAAAAVVRAWRDEVGPIWWARAKARVAGWLRRQADRLSPPEARKVVTVTLDVRAVLTESTTTSPASEQAAQPAHTPTQLPRPRKHAARPVPQKAAARYQARQGPNGRAQAQGAGEAEDRPGARWRESARRDAQASHVSRPHQAHQADREAPHAEGPVGPTPAPLRPRRVAVPRPAPRAKRGARRAIGQPD
jgi:hypothetical protein